MKNLFSGAGDSFKAEATFSHGATKYVLGGTVDTAGAGRFLTTSGTQPGSTIAFGYALDGLYSGTTAATGTSISLANAWEVSAFYEHYWTPAWRTSLFGNYSQISYGSGAQTAAFIAALGNPAQNTNGIFTITNGTVNTSWAQVGTRTAWQPIKDLTFSAEFLYSRIMPAATGTFTNAGLVSGGLAGGVYTIGSQNLFNGAVQVTRSF